MFKKLRNRFLVLNLVIISVMMFFAFASIYFITYKDVYTSIDMELHKISDFYHKPISDPIHSDDLQPEHRDNIKPSSERYVSFAINTDGQWNITDTSSKFNMDSEFYENAKKIAVSQNKEEGNFKLDDNYWAFLIQPSKEGKMLIFLDITSQQAILKNLVYTFLGVAIVMFIIIFFISRFFANRSIQPVKEAFDKQKQFIADASHELMTPLAVIDTNIDYVLSNGDYTISNQSKWLHYIKSEVQRMTKLTNDLLYLTQIDYSKIKKLFADFNLSEVVEYVILTMEAVIFEKDIVLNYDLEPNLITHGNSEQIKQVIMILLDNALKYTNTKGSIDISLKKKHKSIVLSVANTGEGIPEEYLDKIFDRFYRADKSRTRKLGSYGLGLAIAKAIIDQHKGRIYAKSVINECTTFYLELPLLSA